MILDPFDNSLELGSCNHNDCNNHEAIQETVSKLPTNICPICNKLNHSKNEFCSKECFQKGTRVALACKHCSKNFHVLRCFSDKQFCSQKCANKFRSLNHISIRKTITCAWCSREFQLFPSQIRSEKNQFCNRDCYLEFHSRLQIQKECETCQKVFTTSSLYARKFCSRTCYKLGYEPRNFHPKFNKGWFQSNKAGKIWYDSALELKRFKELDWDDSVVRFERCQDKIPWEDEKGVHFYHPDLTIFYQNDVVVVEECKGFTNDSTKKKVEAAHKFYQNSDRLYRIIYEKDLDEEIESFVETYENSLGVFNRPRTESVFMNCALLFAKRSTCNRLSVGALFLDPRSEQVFCFGYNGSCAGDINGCESFLPGKCGCIHAEVNAMSKATQSLENSVLFVTTAPCSDCAKLLINRRIAKVVYLKGYRNNQGIKLLRNVGIEVVKYQDVGDFDLID